MSMQVEKRGDVFVLDLGDGENRFNPTWVAGVEDALVTVVNHDGPRALVTTATGKFWSNGLDLDWMGSHPDESPEFLDRVHNLFARVLAAGVPTIAAVQGHAFAAGAMLAIAHDRILMRRDRGYWCVPEVDLGLPFTPGMSALLQARMSTAAAHEAMTTGRRYTGPDAVQAGFVAATRDLDDIVDAAVEWAGEQAPRAGSTLGTIKERMYASTISVLTTPVSDS